MLISIPQKKSISKSNPLAKFKLQLPYKINSKIIDSFFVKFAPYAV